jgi:tRNA(His) guanylyltransferase
LVFDSSLLDHKLFVADLRAGHINNLYNTTFWALVQQGGMSQTAAEEFLKGTVAADKNEILWSRFGLNYNNELEMFKKGSVVLREYALENAVPQSTEDECHSRALQEADEESGAATEVLSKTQAERWRKARRKAKVVTLHVDVIRDNFWDQRPWLRSGKPGQPAQGEGN